METRKLETINQEYNQNRYDDAIETICLKFPHQKSTIKNELKKTKKIIEKKIPSVPRKLAIYLRRGELHGICVITGRQRQRDGERQSKRGKIYVKYIRYIIARCGLHGTRLATKLNSKLSHWLSCAYMNFIRNFVSDVMQNEFLFGRHFGNYSDWSQKKKRRNLCHSNGDGGAQQNSTWRLRSLEYNKTKRWTTKRSVYSMHAVSYFNRKFVTPLGHFQVRCIFSSAEYPH